MAWMWKKRDESQELCEISPFFVALSTGCPASNIALCLFLSILLTPPPIFSKSLKILFGLFFLQVFSIKRDSIGKVKESRVNKGKIYNPFSIAIAFKFVWHEGRHWPDLERYRPQTSPAASSCNKAHGPLTSGWQKHKGGWESHEFCIKSATST